MYVWYISFTASKTKWLPVILQIKHRWEEAKDETSFQKTDCSFVRFGAAPAFSAAYRSPCLSFCSALCFCEMMMMMMMIRVPTMTKLSVYSGRTLWMNGNMHSVLFFRGKKEKVNMNILRTSQKISSLRVRPNTIKKDTYDKLQYRLQDTGASDHAKFRIYVIYVWTPIFLKRWHWLFYCNCATTELKTRKTLQALLLSSQIRGVWIFFKSARNA